MRTPLRLGLSLAGYPALAVCLVLLWQLLTVSVNFGGNWTALFCTGGIRGAPPELASEHIYTFPGSYGYDGQFYHYMAHDPLFRHGLDRYVDAPRLRYRRILVPALAYLLAAGQSHAVDAAYMAVCLLFVALGVYWSGECTKRPALGLLFLLFPAVIVSVDRLVTDGALAALAVAFVRYRPPWKLYIVLVAATLARETGFLLLAGYCLYELYRGRWKPAALFATAGLPALAWYGFVQLRTSPYILDHTFVPLASWWHNLIHPVAYPPGVPLAWLATATDRLALLGMLLAFALALWRVRMGNLDPPALAGLLFALIGAILQRDSYWTNVYAFGRIYTPLLVFLAAQGLRARSWLWITPVLCTLPRIGMALGTQFAGIGRAMMR